MEIGDSKHPTYLDSLGTIIVGCSDVLEKTVDICGKLVDYYDQTLPERFRNSAEIAGTVLCGLNVLNGDSRGRYRLFWALGAGLVGSRIATKGVRKLTNFIRNDL